MKVVEDHNSPPSLSHMMFGDGTPKKAFFTALVVGTILTLINHGDLLIAGDAPPALKVMLTYCVPYCVTTWARLPASAPNGVGTMSRLRRNVWKHHEG